MSTDVQSQAAGAARDDARPALHELEAALLELPGIAECAVVRRSGGQGAPVAYVVSSGGPFSRSRAEGLLAERWPGLAPLEALVLVSRLPLRGDGALDEEALAAIPIVDEALAAQLEAALAADARIARAVVFADEIPRKPKALHVDALLSQALKAPLEKPAEARAPGASKDTGAAAPEVRFEPPSDLPLAVCIGEPLRRAADRTGTLPDVLRSAAERVQERRITYLKNDGTTVEQSFAELYAEAARIARGLAERGLVPGDYVILQLAEPSDILSAFWGALIGGFVPAITPVPASYAAETNELERLAHIFRMLNAPACVTTAELSRSIGPLCDTSGLPRERVLELEALRRSEPVESAAARSAHDVAFLMFTSGSTGAPKVISLSHANILTRSEGTNRLCRHEESDRILNWLPFDHIGSISDWHLRCVDLGCHMIYCSKEYVLGEPLNWLRLMDRFRITHSWAPNFAYALVNDALNRADEHFDLRPMKALLTAGEAVSSQTVREFLKRLEAGGLASTALRPAFGMAELGSGVTYFQPTPEHPIRVKHVDRNRLDGALRLVEPDDPQAIAFTSLGPVIPGAGMRIVDEANRPLRELCIGRLQISGGPVMLGYLQNEEANREVFVGDGWFNCGDRGFITDGELYLTGRDKESLIINGANFHNSEIEAAVEEVDGVDVSFTAACAVRPAGATEEHLAIFFSPLPGVGSAQLTSILKRVQNSISRKTGVKPDYLLPVERAVIPKTAIGKIQRKQLVKRFEADEFVELSRQVAVLLEGENTVPDWFLAPVWRVKRVREKSPQRSPRRCLIVGDAAGLARELELLLEQRGYSVERRAALAGAAELAFSHVVDLTHFAAPRAWDASGLAERAARELVAIAAGVAQAAAFVDSARGATNLRYLAVTSGSATVSPDDAVDPIRTMLPGAFKALAQEIERVDCRQLDVPFTSDPQAFTEIARAVADELGHAGDDEEVARRDGKRWVRCFERVSFAGAPAAPLVRGGLYLVTGGLGGVGTMLARQLLGTWGLKLLLVGRAPLESGSPKAAVLAELEALGTVRYRALGGASPRALAELVREVEQDLGVTLSGAFHLAGEYHELPMADETVESLSPVLAAKLDGALALHALLEERPGAFVAAFSSLAGVFSGSGLGAYAVANRFLDSLSHVRRARGQRSYSLNWSVWQGLGIAAAGAPVDLLRSKGYLPISAVPGVRSLVAALGGAPGQLLVGVDTGHARMRRLGGPSENVIGLRGLVVRREVAGDTQPLDGAPAAGVADRFGVAVSSELWPVSALPLTDAGDVDRDAALAVLRGTGRAPVAPQTPLQVELVGIWKEVLGVE
ncbi:MAG TPA: AMP-binding protein, partial [Polyangiaceae bacterium]